MADDEREENEQEQEELATKDRQGREQAAALKSMTDKASRGAAGQPRGPHAGLPMAPDMPLNVTARD
ncbi:hypothetical protein GPECTOR_3g426 [Gonium pectorale]|uniref:Uncharacterized protein n=1 Tax=Gonium pectorale TaxID=33097 RepID=A0A150H148_GONPE|nr:hypothetical protein GPECTOR_3g426 [Gonium pectorale]|eukprot:KXZ55290.1 hypothetical protein GPECTOR_3g426 [Gonium pectorale]